MTPNTALAYRMLDRARANPDAFDMDTWGHKANGKPIDLDDLTVTDCGTTACLAGWVVANAGYQFDADGQVYKDNVRVERPNWDPGVTELENLATDLLGIDLEQAADLFWVVEGDLDEAVEDIFGPRPTGDPA